MRSALSRSARTRPGPDLGPGWAGAGHSHAAPSTSGSSASLLLPPGRPAPALLCSAWSRFCSLWCALMGDGARKLPAVASAAPPLARASTTASFRLRFGTVTRFDAGTRGNPCSCFVHEQPTAAPPGVAILVEGVVLELLHYSQPDVQVRSERKLCDGRACGRGCPS